MFLFVLQLLSLAALSTHGFVPASSRISFSNLNQNGPLWMSGDDLGGGDTRERIQSLVDENPILLFMKGSKLFPQCGFSNTATQILMSFNVDFHTVDVLADENIRQGIKEFSQWPTIPQLYVDGEFIGGSDIMIEMYQSGELGEMVEKAKANQM